MAGEGEVTMGEGGGETALWPSFFIFNIPFSRPYTRPQCDCLTGTPLASISINIQHRVPTIIRKTLHHFKSQTQKLLDRSMASHSKQPFQIPYTPTRQKWPIQTHTSSPQPIPTRPRCGTNAMLSFPPYRPPCTRINSRCVQTPQLASAHRHVNLSLHLHHGHFHPSTHPILTPFRPSETPFPSTASTCLIRKKSLLGAEFFSGCKLNTGRREDAILYVFAEGIWGCVPVVSWMGARGDDALTAQLGVGAA